MLETYHAQKRAGRFEASRPHTAGDRFKRLERMMAQLRDVLMHRQSPAAYSPEDMQRAAPASYADEMAAQRASLEALERLAHVDALDEEPVGVLHAHTFTSCCRKSSAWMCRLRAADQKAYAPARVILASWNILLLAVTGHGMMS